MITSVLVALEISTPPNPYKTHLIVCLTLLIALKYDLPSKIEKTLQKIVIERYADSILDENDGSIWIKGEDEESFMQTVDYAKKLLKAGVKYVTPLIATPYPGTDLYDNCEKFGWLRRADFSEMVTTISYQNPKVEFINIDTPWCSADEAFARWEYMADIFPVKHNVVKK